MALSYNLGYQESISVHPTRRQIFAGKPDSTFPNIWQWLIHRNIKRIFRQVQIILANLDHYRNHDRNHNLNHNRNHNRFHNHNPRSVLVIISRRVWKAPQLKTFRKIVNHDLNNNNTIIDNNIKIMNNNIIIMNKRY